MSSSDNVLNVTISSGEEDDVIISDFELGNIETISDENYDSDSVQVVQINSSSDQGDHADTDTDYEDPDMSFDLSQFSEADDSFVGYLNEIQGLSKAEFINKNTIIYTYQRSASSTEPQEPQEACSICLDYFGIGQTIRRLPCFHQFHIGCADDWLAKQIQCPECRTKITAEVA